MAASEGLEGYIIDTSFWVVCINQVARQEITAQPVFD